MIEYSKDKKSMSDARCQMQSLLLCPLGIQSAPQAKEYAADVCTKFTNLEQATRTMAAL
jgi:hypothetical protein